MYSHHHSQKKTSKGCFQKNQQIFISSLSPYTTEEDILNFFNIMALPVISLKLIKNNKNGLSKGCCYVSLPPHINLHRLFKLDHKILERRVKFEFFQTGRNWKRTTTKKFGVRASSFYF